MGALSRRDARFQLPISASPMRSGTSNWTSACATPRPPAGHPRAADDGTVARLLPAARLIGQRSAPRRLGLEGVVDHHVLIAAVGGAGAGPPVLPALQLGPGAHRQLLGGLERGGVG